MSSTQVFQSSQTWTVPNDWKNTANTVEAYGEGGHGGTSLSTAGGGGGGAYAASSNISLTPGNTVTLTVGAGSTATPTSFGSTVIADFGAALSGGGSGSGGLVANSTGSTRFAGGNGGSSGGGGFGAGGGGGAAGPNGAGANGSAGSIGGGGGAGGQGDNGTGGAGGAGGLTGVGGGGSNGTEATGAVGGGGGGSGSGGVTGGGGGAAGGLGGGGGGSEVFGTGGTGANGAIVISYTADAPTAPSALTFTGITTVKIGVVVPALSGLANSYDLQRAPDVSGSAGTYATIQASVTPSATYNDTGRASNTKYWYRLVAVNTNSSVNGTGANATTLATGSGIFDGSLMMMGIGT